MFEDSLKRRTKTVKRLEILRYREKKLIIIMGEREGRKFSFKRKKIDYWHLFWVRFLLEGTTTQAMIFLVF